MYEGIFVSWPCKDFVKSGDILCERASQIGRWLHGDEVLQHRCPLYTRNLQNVTLGAKSNLGRGLGLLRAEERGKSQQRQGKSAATFTPGAADAPTDSVADFAQQAVDPMCNVLYLFRTLRTKHHAAG